MRQVIFDVETIKTFDQVDGYYPEKLGVSFVGLIERVGLPEAGSVQEFTYQIFESDIPQIWPIFERADVLVGFNSDGFDLPALQPYYNGTLKNLPSLDLLSRIKDSLGRRISLDSVAQSTLGSKKIGHGLDAIRYYQNQEWDKLAQYCLKDVELTRDLYDFGRQHGIIKFLNHWNNLIEAPVDFTFNPPSETATTQMTLI